MIFLNRRRSPLKDKIIKDPSKYWYIEKYVYGELKETVEVPLGEGTTFTSIESGYLDDTFACWSSNSTRTVNDFSATLTYTNTTTSVKNLLDSENTIKIYAVYYYFTVGKSFSLSGNTTHEFTMKDEANLILNGYTTTRTLILSNGNTIKDTSGTSKFVFHILNNDGTSKADLGTGPNSPNRAHVFAGDQIRATTVDNMTMPNGSNGPPSGTFGGAVSQSVSIISTGDMYYHNILKHRVESHTY